MSDVTAVLAAGTTTRLTLLVGVIQVFIGYPTVVARFGIKQALESKAGGKGSLNSNT